MNRVHRVVKNLPFVVLPILAFCLLSTVVFAEPIAIPGTDKFDKLTAAGDLIRIIDSFIFKFGARMMAGLAVLGAGWNLKEQRFAMALICIFAAILIATVPMWIKNIFDIGSGSIFS